jgi:glycosyltransferase involved in cell wall biosynthesis
MLAIISSIAVAGHGGVEVLVRELVRGLGGNEPVHLIAPDQPAEITRLGLDSFLAGYLRTDPTKPFSDIAAEWDSWLRSQGIDTLHFHFGGPYSWGAGDRDGGLLPRLRRLGFRIFVTNHQAVSPFSASKQAIPLPRRLAAHFKRLPGKLRQLAATEKEFLVSQHDLTLSRRWFPFQNNKFGQIYHSKLDADSPSPSLPESRIILCLATLCFRKGQHILTEAFASVAEQYPDWTLRLTGMHTERGCIEHIRQIIDRHGLAPRIELPGPSDTPWDEIANAEIYVQPSLLEGLGLSLQEAAFAARPCIGSNTGGIPELITHNVSGLLVPPANPADLATALTSLIESREKRVQLGNTARKEIQQKGMTRQGMIHTYQNLYHSSSLHT